VSAKAFLALVESYLNGNYCLYLIVEEMPEKKMFSCRKCGKPFEVYPPDDAHITALLEKRENAIEMKHKCDCNLEIVLYWIPKPRPIIRSTRC